MPGAIIRIDQGVSEGEPGEARKDLKFGDITLVSTVEDNDNQLWELLDEPGGSSAVLEDEEEVEATLTVNEPGTYRVKLSTNDGAYSQTLVIGVSKNEDNTTVFRGWRIPAFSERASEANFNGTNTRGWTETMEAILRDVNEALEALEEGGGGAGLPIDLSDAGVSVENVLGVDNGGTGLDATYLAAHDGEALTVSADGLSIETQPIASLPLALTDLDTTGGSDGDVLTVSSGVVTLAPPVSPAPVVTQHLDNVAGNGSSGSFGTNWTGTYAAGGGLCVIYASAGIYSSSDLQILSLLLKIDGSTVATASAFFNDSGKHGQIGPLVYAAVLAPGDYTIALEGSGTNVSCDSNDFARVTILEYPA